MAGVVLANRESLRHLVNKIDVCDHKQLASNVIDKYECATKNKDTAIGYDFGYCSDIRELSHPCKYVTVRDTAFLSSSPVTQRYRSLKPTESEEIPRVGGSPNG